MSADFHKYMERRAEKAAVAFVLFLGGFALFVLAVFMAGFVVGYWSGR